MPMLADRLVYFSFNFSGSMKFDLPEIVWHGTQPIYCCDFQRVSNDSDLRMATGGADNEVKLWKVWVYEEKVS